MSSRWPAGEILHGATALGSIYQSVPDSSRPQARQFKREFGHLLKQLTLLSELEKRLSQTFSRLGSRADSETSELGGTYHDAIERFARFIDKQKGFLTGDQHHSTATGLQSISRRQTKRLKPTPLEEEIEWEAELEEIRLLQRQLERHSQIATLKLSASSWRQPRYRFRTSPEVLLAKLEMLKATKVLTQRVLTFLEMCLIEQSDTDDPHTFHQFGPLLCRTFLESIEQSPQSIVQRWAARANKNTRKLKLSRSASISEQSLYFFYKSSQIMAYMTMRWGPTRISRPSTGRIAQPQHAIKTVHRRELNVSSGSVLESLESLYNLVCQCLNRVGLKTNKFLTEAGIQYTNQNQGLERTVREWTELSVRVSYLIMHCDVAPRPLSSGSSAPSSPSQITQPGSTFSLPYHTYLPSSHETLPSPTGFRRPSYYSHHAANRASISTLSSMDLGTPWDIVHATLGLVQIKLPDTQSERVPSTIPCSVDIVSHPNSGEVVSIVALREDVPGTIRHTIYENRSLSSFIPYLDNMHVYGDNDHRYRLRFQGVHRMEIEENRQVQTYITTPIYICRDEEDYLSFQSGLLKKEVKFIADTAQIISNGEEKLVDVDTVRVLQDRGNGRRSILFYAAYRGPDVTAGFMEWPVNAFKPVKKRLGLTGIELRLTRAAIERRKRRGANAPVEQLETQSLYFSGLDGDNDNLSEINAMAFHFYETKDRDEFREWLKE